MWWTCQICATSRSLSPGEREEALLQGQGQRSSVTGGGSGAVLRCSEDPSNWDQGFMT